MSQVASLYPVILCGGDGTRLWPASRKALPKQFMPLGDSTLFKRTLHRAYALPNISSPLILCNNEHRFLVASQIQDFFTTVPPHTPNDTTIILEPVGKNTAPAIALAALHLEDEDPLLLIMPSDHELKNSQDFYTAVEAGRKVAEKGYLVAFGILPTSAETGYGYIERGERIENSISALHIKQFVEKPDAIRAEAFVNSGDYYWNSGIFLLRVSTFLQELEKFSPDILTMCRKAYEKRSTDLDFIRVDEASFTNSPSNSIDYAVMEHTKKACVIPLKTEWSDLGSWQSLYAMEETDANGNVFSGDVISCDSSNMYVLSQHRLVATLGVDNLVIVETPDVVMVVKQEHSQEVKKLVKILRETGRKETDLHSRVYRPWGSYESIISEGRFQVKRLIVAPGQQLSLQRHYHRAEHWVVVQGTAQVFVNGKELLLGEDESTYIPIGGIHRLANPGKVPLEIIEIQTGSYLGEDDIERLEDQYGR